jgi:hypothetical protein
MDKFPTVNELMEMAKNNPGLLNDLQKKENDKIINRQTDEMAKKKLEGIIFKMNMIKIKNKKNHFKTAMDISDMMNESKDEMIYQIKDKFGSKPIENSKPNLKIVSKKKED